MAAPILAVLATFLSGIRAVVARSGDPSSRDYTDPLGHKFRINRFGDLDPAEGTNRQRIEALFSTPEQNRSYRQLVKSYQTAQKQSAEATLLALQLQDVKQTQDLSHVQPGDDLTVPLLAVVALFGAALIFR
jgi:hypothetical protein